MIHSRDRQTVQKKAVASFHRREGSGNLPSTGTIRFKSFTGEEQKLTDVQFGSTTDRRVYAPDGTILAKVPKNGQGK